MSRITRADMQRLLRSALTVELTEETRHAHLAAIEAAVTRLPTPVQPEAARAHFRRRFAAATALMMALSPVSVAVAAEQAVPGDRLYPVKLVTESVRSVVDPLVTARHRVEELETLIERGSDPSLINDALTVARASVEPLEEAHALVERLRQVEEQLEELDTEETGEESSGISDDDIEDDDGEEDNDGEEDDASDDDGDDESEDDASD